MVENQQRKSNYQKVRLNQYLAQEEVGDGRSCLEPSLSAVIKQVKCNIKW